MMKIINGHKYNTQTSVLIGIYNIWADEGRYSFTEILFYKRTNEFFIYRHGGERDEKDIDDSYWVIRPEIYPISFQEAKKWTKKHCSKHKLISLFGDEHDEEPNKCSLSSRTLWDKRELRALPFLNK